MKMERPNTSEVTPASQASSGRSKRDEELTGKRPTYEQCRTFVLGKFETRQLSRFRCPKCGWATNWSENQLKVQNKSARHIFDEHVEKGDWSF